MQVAIRPMEIADATSVTKLSKQFGYRNSVEEMEVRIAVMLQQKCNCLFVAVTGGNVNGWIHGSHVTRIESGSFAEIGGLVVDQNSRQQGIGKQLVKAVTNWAIEKGITKLRVRCNINRPASHQFYHNRGFILNKEQKVFDMGL